eukprot:TRINITY_DN464_c0_g1_i3.p3 TRINITY_DN464_c0_g1~~TRINITY_DN464_c0_g1_i3.p3  ORF type:complete len:103 (+),score=20.51 TRINITY_DN464_c0_g1_i3:690-998(+)
MPLQFHSDQFGDYDAASPPPLPGPFSHISSSEPTKIHAPADLVYNIVADLAGYPEWNVFNPRAVGELRVGMTLSLECALSRSPETQATTAKKQQQHRRDSCP